METHQIHRTTLDILLVEPPNSQSSEEENLPAAAPSGRDKAVASRQLALGYHVALARADEKRLESIAFPGVDLHACGCPARDAADAAVDAVRDYVNKHPHTGLRRILFVQYTPEAYDAFCGALKNLAKNAEG